MIIKRGPSAKYAAAGLQVATLACVTALISGDAFAQASPYTDDAPEEAIEEVVVTGSRIARRGVDTPTPMTTVDAAAIKASGLNDITSLVNQLPSLYVSLTDQQTNQTRDGSAGLSSLDLRGMGTERTLVLVNGRRQVPGMPGTSQVDTTSISPALIDRVEVITGGASATYGADAVAGAVNFIMKRDFEGWSGNVQAGHTGRGGESNISTDLTWGRNFGGGRGNLTLFGSYYDADPIEAVDRPWTANPPNYTSNPSGDTPALVQANPPMRALYDHEAAVVLLGGMPYTFSPSGEIRPVQLGPSGLVGTETWDPFVSSNLVRLKTDGGEFGGRYDDYLLRVPVERSVVASSYKYDVTDNTTFFGDVRFARVESSHIWSAPRTYGSSHAVLADAPWVTQEMETLNGGPVGDLYFSRTWSQLGRGVMEVERDMLQVTNGLAGNFEAVGRPWRWEAYHSFGKTDASSYSPVFNVFSRIEAGLDAVDDGSGNIVCRSTLIDPANGCVPINPFIDLTQGQIDWIQIPGDTDHSKLKQSVVSGYLGTDLLELPAGPLAVVLGVEHRTEDSKVLPSPTNLAGLADVTAMPIIGEYDVSEIFGETRIPILNDVTGFQLLAVEAAFRYADYSTAGRYNSYRYALDWRIVDAVRLRSSFSHAVRAPNIAEVFTPGVQGGAWINHPCNDYNLANRAGTTEDTIANCATLDHTQAYLGGFWFWETTIQEGNPNLKVEKADTYTIGAAFTPSFAPNLSLTVDYWDIELTNAIDSFNVQTIINKCFDSPGMSSVFCDLVLTRDNDEIDTIELKEVNLARFVTRGIDYELNYNASLEDTPIGGTFEINALFTKLLERTFLLDPDAPDTIDDTLGEFGAPEWKGAIRTAYHRDNFHLNLTNRYFTGQVADNQETDMARYPRDTGDMWYTDLSFTYDLGDHLSVHVGGTNVFDKGPPPIQGAEAGGANFENGVRSGLFDTIGRQYYLGVRLNY